MVCRCGPGAPTEPDLLRRVREPAPRAVRTGVARPRTARCSRRREQSHAGYRCVTTPLPLVTIDAAGMAKSRTIPATAHQTARSVARILTTYSFVTSGVPACFTERCFLRQGRLAPGGMRGEPRTKHLEPHKGGDDWYQPPSITVYRFRLCVFRYFHWFGVAFASTSPRMY